MNNVYLIPTVTNEQGTVMEYEVVVKKRDMRTVFCRTNDSHIVGVVVILNAVSAANAKVNDERIIMPDARSARIFAKEIEKGTGLTR